MPTHPTKVCPQCFEKAYVTQSRVQCNVCDETLHTDCALKEGKKFFCDTCFVDYMKNSKKKNKPKFDLPEVIRRSHIETYKSCPTKFYHEVIKGIEAPPTMYTQVGIDLHELFDKACNDRTFSKGELLSEMMVLWYNYPTSLFPDDDAKDKMYVRINESVEEFYRILETLPTTPFTTEEKIEFEVDKDLPRVSITMDRIDMVDGELEVHDWKTGAVMVGKKFTTDLQAPLYIYAVQQKFNIPVRKFHFHYLQEQKTRVFERTEIPHVYSVKVKNNEYKIDLYDAIREVNGIFQHIRNGNFNIPKDIKSMYFACKMCHLKEAGACSGADSESWKQSNYGVG